MSAPSRPIIRRARPEDAAGFLAHIRRVIAEPQKTSPLEPVEFTTTVEQQVVIWAQAEIMQSGLFLVAEAEGSIVAELSLKRGTRLAFRHAAILGMSVAAEWRRCGIGRLLLTEALTWAKEIALLRRIELYVYANNDGAIRLYREFGFVVEGERVDAIFQDGVYRNDLLMARRIRHD